MINAFRSLCNISQNPQFLKKEQSQNQFFKVCTSQKSVSECSGCQSREHETVDCQGGPLKFQQYLKSNCSNLDTRIAPSLLNMRFLFHLLYQLIKETVSLLILRTPNPSFGDSASGQAVNTEVFVSCGLPRREDGV